MSNRVIYGPVSDQINIKFKVSLPFLFLYLIMVSNQNTVHFRQTTND